MASLRYYKSYDGHAHHGFITGGEVDQFFAEESEEQLWQYVIDYVDEYCDGKATVNGNKV